MTTGVRAGSFRTGRGTHTGCVRDHNEDSFRFDEQVGVWVVADGMGGHSAGEVASGIVVERVERAVASGETLVDALHQANDAVIELASGTHGRRGMGSTAVVLRILSDRYEIAWVGDSRAYRWNGNELQLLTRDHSLVQELLDTGSISAEEAINHPHKHLITRAVGMNNGNLEVEQVGGALGREDCFLICSDGLTGELSEGEISNFFRDLGNEQDIVDCLIDAALERGGRDNVTVLVVTPEAHTAS